MTLKSVVRGFHPKAYSVNSDMIEGWLEDDEADDEPAPSSLLAAFIGMRDERDRALARLSVWEGK